MRLERWHSVTGADLENAVSIGEPLDDLVLQCQAVYMWRRALTPPTRSIANAVRFEDWVGKILEKPFSRIGSVDLSHCVHLLGVELGGGQLTEEKAETLTEFIQTPNSRTWIASFIGSLTAYTPPIYVGETMDLNRRIKEHVRGETQFSVVLKEQLGLEWSDLEFCYYGISKKTSGEDSARSKALRTLLELVAARLVFAGSVGRPG